MSWCSVLGCQEVKSSLRKAHSFPGVDETELRECWIKFCGQQPDWNPNKQAKICGAHFNDSDFGLDVKGNIKKKLKFGAVPNWKNDIPIKMDDPLESQFTNVSNRETSKEIEEMTCRICLTENPEAPISLFSHFEDQTVAQIMSYCTSLEVNQEDRLPKIVCDICFLKLRAAKELKETSITSDSILRQSVLKYCTINVKQEDDIGRAYESLSIKVEPMEMLTVESYQNEETAVKAPAPAPPKKKKRKKNKSVNMKRRPKKIPAPIIQTADDSLLHKCDDCGKKFDNFTWFDNHRCKTMQRTCTICNSKFKERKEFFQHFKDAHFSDRKCEKCNLVLNSGRALHNHLRTHLQKTNYMCDICSKVFYRPFLLEVHRAAHTQHYQCDLCGIVLISRASITTHITFVHKKTPLIPCPKCPIIFNRKESYDLHQVRAHDVKAPVSCPTCNKKYLYISQVTSHMKNIHMKIRPKASSYDHKCTKCSKVFKHKSTLFIHTKKHDHEHAVTKQGSLQILKYECTSCPKKFSRNQLLIEHNRVHTGERPYQCQQCLMCFKIAKTLRVHLEKIHKEVSPFVSTIPNILPGNMSKIPGSQL